MPNLIESSLKVKGILDSRIGGRQENQDSAGSADTDLGTIVVVCDGMGGCNGGAVASGIAVTTVIDEVSAAPSGSSPVDVLKQAIIHANEAIYDKAQEDPSLSGMGTTIVAALITKQSLIVSYVGDSRVYLLRGKRKIFRTFDHSYVYQALVSKKVITEEQARLSIHSNAILKALGVESTIDPEVFVLPYLKGDRLILCTDGFWGAMPENELISSVCRKNGLMTSMEHTFARIEKIGLAHGGNHDNYTAAIIDLNVESLLRTKMDTRTKVLIAVLSACLLASVSLNMLQFAHRAKTNESVEHFKEEKNLVNPADSSQNADSIKKAESTNVAAEQK